MDAGFLCQTRSPVPSLPRQKRACKLKHRSPVLAVLTRTPDHNMTGEEKKASRPTDKLAGLTKKTTVNNDSWFAKLAINYLSQRFQDATGKDHATTVHVYKRIFCCLHNLVLCLASRTLRDFDDMSCEMIYGQEAPAITEDPAFKQPCYKLCNDLNHPHAKKTESTVCNARANMTAQAVKEAGRHFTTRTFYSDN
ncbi:hypothetical protein POTOM_007448 [Populus tomentosa]|uniref:Uncharacterized protein n=1 Tax=Populus tomentosa TaxID=118781 RepID=A0A8X8AFJ5_POPTO|nr:hypothetical protein POTOM_007448 [Populus tomentosa]